MITNITQYLDETAKLFPNKIAFRDQKKEVTFAQLQEQAKCLAVEIHKKCGDVYNRPIAVFAPKGVECLIAFLGIVYSGNFYSPIDISSPKDRADRILATLNPIAVISTEKPLTEDDIAISGAFDVNEQLTEEYKYDWLSPCDIDPLYVLFTSGSTGMPKGVTISHSGVIDYIEWLVDKFGFDSETSFGQQAPFYFDNSILDIYLTLKCGATCNIIPEKFFTFHGQLIDFLDEYKVNTIFWVPSALVSVANSGVLNLKRPNTLKKILFCGEVMPNKQLNMWRKNLPDALYANLYGPTEITDVCSYYIVNREFADDEPLPIGKACENTEILVLNEHGEKCRIGEAGELCVRGRCLALGYYNDLTKTDTAFTDSPISEGIRQKIYHTGDIVKYNDYGELIYLSRKDYQIKHQGHRIELGEIEIACFSIAGVENCCAIYDDREKQIVLFVASSEPILEKEIYKALKVKIPKYMLPWKIILLRELPINQNGKVDRVKVKKDYEERD